MKNILIAFASILLLHVVSGAQTVVPFNYRLIDSQNPRHPHTTTVGDIDGDGFVDVSNASADGYTDGLWWYRYPAWTKALVDTGSFPGDRQNGDIDGDGDIDLVALRGFDSGISLWWYENPRPLGNPATATWTRHFIDNVPSHDVELADINQDGRLDIVIRRDTLVVFFQDTGVTWQKVAISGRPKDGTGIGDIDSDGDLDIAINGYWYENPLPLGNPATTTWAEHFVVAGWSNQVAVRVEDVNSDGRKDIILAPSGGSFGGRISWYETTNPLTGPWTEHIIRSATDPVHTFKAADFDLDGDLDIITGEGHWGNDPDDIILWINLGGGLSWYQQTIATTGIHNLRIADIGNDGDMDLVGCNATNVVNPYGSPLEMWENTLIDGVGPPIIVTEPTNQSAVVGQTATFSVAAAGSSLVYRWQKNNIDIGGGTSASYTTPALLLSDNGAQYRCIISNSFGTDTTQQATLTVTSGPPPSNIVSDEFNTTHLNTTLWTFINPKSDAVVSVNGTQLLIGVPGGTSHDVWTEGNKAPRIMQDCNDADFEVEIKFSSPMSSQYQLEGIIVQQDAANFLRFNLQSDGTTIRALAVSFVSGNPTIRFQYSLGANGIAPLHMRVVRTDDTWSLSYSTNGSSWTTAGGFTHSLAVHSVGPFAGNAGGNPAFSCLIDYFRNTGVVTVNSTALLQGPYADDGDSMRTDVHGFLPRLHPFGEAPWNYAGSDSVASVPVGVVDWVLLELRTSTDPASYAGSRAALLITDGHIVDLDGISPVSFFGVQPGSYHIVLRHRNHLDIMSAAPIALNHASSLFDFSLANSQAYGTSPMIQVGVDRFALCAGDVNASGVISASDANSVFNALNRTGYEMGDANLSGIVTASDANVIFSNVNRSSQVP
ncbi:MAG: VCBS repeat-containing protein [Ignavibacteriae bacterium]|nr:VCBS repeat-containing protein [Ignavibacteriota bacterium]